MSRLQRISRLHDYFAQNGYRHFGEGEGQYGVPEAFRAITEQLRLPLEKWSVLDLGCGPGNLIEFAPFKKFTGVDLSPEMLLQAGESGYNELIEANMADYVANPFTEAQDVVVALSCAYFLRPKEFAPFMRNVDRLAKRFWLVTLDGMTASARNVYEEQDDIDTYDHRGVALPWPNVHRITIKGWHSVATDEDIAMDVVYRLK